MDSDAELDVALDVERQLAALLASLPILSELPIAPLRGVDDFVHLELALRRCAEIHRSNRSKARVRAGRAILEGARARLREATAAERSGSHVAPLHDTLPAK